MLLVGCLDTDIGLNAVKQTYWRIHSIVVETEKSILYDGHFEFALLKNFDSVWLAKTKQNLILTTFVLNSGDQPP